MQSTETVRLLRDYRDVKNRLLGYSVDQLPSIFIRVTLLGMNNLDHGNVRGPVRRSERREPKLKVQQ